MDKLIDIIKKEGFKPKRIGKNYVMLCPFHKEKTPSFVIYDNSFYCFGCCNYGNAITFIRKLKKYSFKQTVDYLKLKYNIKQIINLKPSILDTIVLEEKRGINIREKYGKLLIDTLLFNEIKKLSNPK